MYATRQEPRWQGEGRGICIGIVTVGRGPAVPALSAAGAEDGTAGIHHNLLYIQSTVSMAYVRRCVDYSAGDEMRD
jgi:hypothetical protein